VTTSRSTTLGGRVLRSRSVLGGGTRTIAVNSGSRVVLNSHVVRGDVAAADVVHRVQVVIVQTCVAVVVAVRNVDVVSVIPYLLIPTVAVSAVTTRSSTGQDDSSRTDSSKKLLQRSLPCELYLCWIEAPRYSHIKEAVKLLLTDHVLHEQVPQYILIDVLYSHDHTGI